MLQATADELLRASPKGVDERLLKTFYEACLAEDNINVAGAAPLKAMSDQVASIRSWEEVKQVIPWLHRQIAAPPLGSVQFPVVPGFYFGSWTDSENPAQTIVRIGPAGLGLPSAAYYNSADAKRKPTQDRYRTHIERLFSFAGFSGDQARAAAVSVYSLESRMARAGMTPSELRDPEKGSESRSSR